MRRSGSLSRTRLAEVLRPPLALTVYQIVFTEHQMNSRFRTFIFRHYVWLIPLGWLLTVGVVFFASKPDNLATNIVATTGVALSLTYFLQKQSLEELELFEGLFTRFNERYAQLHDRLQGIVHLNGEQEATQDQRQALDRYFNLCAEEYLFYDRGCILPLVWRAWCRGTLWYLTCERIHLAFQEEVNHDSHYGLTLLVIERSAGVRLVDVNRDNDWRPVQH